VENVGHEEQGEGPTTGLESQDLSVTVSEESGDDEERRIVSREMGSLTKPSHQSLVGSRNDAMLLDPAIVNTMFLQIR
jgi:hypothetical protein